MTHAWNAASITVRIAVEPLLWSNDINSHHAFWPTLNVLGSLMVHCVCSWFYWCTNEITLFLRLVEHAGLSSLPHYWTKSQPSCNKHDDSYPMSEIMSVLYNTTLKRYPLMDTHTYGLSPWAQPSQQTPTGHRYIPTFNDVHEPHDNASQL